MKKSTVSETELVVYVGLRKIILLEGALNGQEARVRRFVVKTHPAGFQNGYVSNLGDACQTIEQLLEDLYPGHEASPLAIWTVLGTPKTQQFSFMSSQYYSGEGRVIHPQEIRSVIQQTRSVATLPLSEQILQTVPESFLVDDATGVKNPIGLEARRLGVTLKIFSMNYQEFKNMVRVMESVDLDVLGYFPKSLTVSEAVLTEEEKQQGVVVMDLSDAGTQLIFWKNGVLQNSKEVPIGGRRLTERISMAWGIEMHDGEKLKEQYGSLNPREGFSDELVPLVERNGIESRPVKRSEFQQKFSQIAAEWTQELLSAFEQFKKEQGIYHPHVVVTGGGASLDGLIEYLQRQHELTARVGLIKKLEAPHELSIDPSMTGALGMFRWLVTYGQDYKHLLEPTGFFQRTLASARDWFQTYF